MKIKIMKMIKRKSTIKSRTLLCRFAFVIFAR